MKSIRHFILLLLVVLAGAGASFSLSWAQEWRRVQADAARSAERVLSMLSLYPFEKADAGALNLVAKVLVEQFGSGIVYLRLQDAEGSPLLSIGDETLAGGGIVEIVRTLNIGRPGGSVRMGMRIPMPPVFSAPRVSSVAAVVFLMLAAVVVGYYTIYRALRQWGRAVPGDVAAGAGQKSDDILESMERMNRQLVAIQGEMRQVRENNADLSSRLGIAGFETQQAYQILESLDFGVLIVDSHDRIRRANKAILGMLGSTQAGLGNKPYGEALQHPDLVRLLDGRHEGGGTAATVETQFTETEPERFFSLSARALSDADGDVIGTLVVVQDITRMKLMRKAQENFLAEVAHEMLTPLTSMKAYSEMLMTGTVTDRGTQNDFYNTINSETDRLTSLVRNLLNVSRMESGSLTIERRLVKTDWLLDQCLPAIEATAVKKSIRVDKHLPDVFPTILGDKELLKVMLVNILGNAVKYTQEGGAIRVVLSEQNRQVLFEVSDTGCGIPPKELPYLFQKFYRGLSEEVRAQIGSGLGLATALQIAKLHGGTIDVTSEPGKGSCFTMRIPAEDFSLEKQ